MPPDPTPGDGTVSVRLPPELVRAVATRLEGTGFASVDAFVAFVLARLVDSPAHPGFSEEDERRLREQLRALGYID